MYERTLATFAEVVFEDPHDLPAVLELLTPIADRVSYDAPITSVESLGATPIAVRIVEYQALPRRPPAGAQPLVRAL